MRFRYGWLALGVAAVLGFVAWNWGVWPEIGRTGESDARVAGAATGHPQTGRDRPTGDASATDFPYPPQDPVGRREQAAARACEFEYQRRLARHLRELERSSDARSQLALALLAHASPAMLDPRHPHHRAMQQRAGDAFAEVARLLPDDPISAWADASRCRAGDRCTAAFDRLARIEPDNAAVWLMAYHRASQRKDIAAAEAHLARAAQAKYYDFHWGDNPLFLRDALPAEPFPECMQADARDAGPDAFALLVGSMLSMQDMPAFTIQACTAPRLRMDDNARVAQCRAVYRLVADSDTMLGRSIGASKMVMLTAGEVEQAHWRERVREIAWIQEEGYPLPQDDAVSAVYERGEWTVMVERMQRADKWPVPRGWLPSRDRYRRELIQEGVVSLQ